MQLLPSHPSCHCQHLRCCRADACAGAVGTVCAEGHPLQGCFLCQEAPRVLLHVYEGLPNLDWQSCENGHHQSSMDTAHTRCDWCRLTINKIAAKTPAGGQCDAATNMFDRSCARADHYNGDPTSDSFALTSLPGGCHADDRCHKQPASRIQCQLAHRWPCLLRFRGRVTLVPQTPDGQSPPLDVSTPGSTYAHNCTPGTAPQS